MLCPFCKKRTYIYKSSEDGEEITCEELKEGFDSKNFLLSGFYESFEECSPDCACLVDDSRFFAFCRLRSN